MVNPKPVTQASYPVSKCRINLKPSWIGQLKRTVRSALKTNGSRLGALFILVMIICAFAAPLIAPFDPDKIDIIHRFSGPAINHLLGTDFLGRDLLSRLIYGCRISVLVAFGSVTLSAIFGVILGVAAGYMEGKKLDYLVILVFDVVRSFPQIILALAIVAVFGPSLFNVIIALAVTAFPFYGRVARAQTLTVKSSGFVLAAEAMGLSRSKIIFRHITPNILAPVIVCMGMDMATMIIYAAGLSFLGLGVRPPTASWGVMLRSGYKYIERSPWIILWPALAISLAMIAFSLFSDGLRMALDPKERER